jgi:PKD repeat protein
VSLYARNRAGTVAFVVRNEDGTPTNPTGSVTVTVRDATGTTVATGTATQQQGQTHNCTYALPSAVRTALGKYEVTFAYTLSGISETVVVPVEVVSALLFDVAELRDVYPELSDTNRYTSAEIRSARDEATSRLEQAAQVAFSTRRTIETISGDDTTRLLLPHVEVTAVYSVTVYEETIPGADAVEDAFDANELADVEIYGPAGVLKRTDGEVWPRGNRNVVVEYEHGYEFPPEPVRRAAMKLAVEALVPSALPSRALSQTTDLGEIRLSVANPEAGRPTGDPEIDAVILQFGRRRPTIG